MKPQINKLTALTRLLKNMGWCGGMVEILFSNRATARHAMAG
jgi:hypothetical protein